MSIVSLVIAPTLASMNKPNTTQIPTPKAIEMKQSAQVMNSTHSVNFH
jgi:uncharacterized lipoprotein YajG